MPVAKLPNQTPPRTMTATGIGSLTTKLFSVCLSCRSISRLRVLSQELTETGV